MVVHLELPSGKKTCFFGCTGPPIALHYQHWLTTQAESHSFFCWTFFIEECRFLKPVAVHHVNTGRCPTSGTLMLDVYNNDGQHFSLWSLLRPIMPGALASCDASFSRFFTVFLELNIGWINCCYDHILHSSGQNSIFIIPITASLDEWFMDNWIYVAHF